jgi:hypothetical protein
MTGSQTLLARAALGGVIFRQRIHAALRQGSAPAWFFFILDVLLLAGYAWLLLESAMEIATLRKPTEPFVLGGSRTAGAITLTPP